MAYMFIGPCSPVPWIATNLYPVQFGGVSSPLKFQSTEVISDPLPQGLDMSNGCIVSGWVTDGFYTGGTAWLATKGHESDWYSRWIMGDYAAALDKTKTNDASHPWVNAGVSDYCVLMIEEFYP